MQHTMLGRQFNLKRCSKALQEKTASASLLGEIAEAQSEDEVPIYSAGQVVKN